MRRRNQPVKNIFGKAVFDQNINKKLIQARKVMSAINNKCWYIFKPDYQKYDWKQIFEHMEECLCQRIWLGWTAQYGKLKQIQNVRFTNLKSIGLSDNCIDNIESISLMDCQQLQSLDLSSNRITQIKAFNKLSISTLRQLYLSKSPIIQVQSLVKSVMHAQKMLFFILEHFQIQNEIQQDLSCVVKLCSPSIHEIYTASSKRISQPKALTMIKSRFPSMVHYHKA